MTDKSTNRRTQLIDRATRPTMQHVGSLTVVDGSHKRTSHCNALVIGFDTFEQLNKAVLTGHCEFDSPLSKQFHALSEE